MRLCNCRVLQITERLQRQQQAWDAKCERDKEAQRAKSVATKQDKSVEEMLLRQEQREKHLRLKHSQREEAERVEREKQLAEEAKKKERLRRRAQLNGVAAKEQVGTVLSCLVLHCLALSYTCLTTPGGEGQAGGVPEGGGR